MAPIGYFASPILLEIVNAAPEVKAEALPFLRIMFVFSSGMLVFFMLERRAALRGRRAHADGARRRGTVLNIVFNVVFIRGLGPIPAYGTAGAAMGT